jgi:thiol-disulfide isomerase/thioredoxin
MSPEAIRNRRHFLRNAALTVAAALPWGIPRTSATQLPFEGEFPSLRGATEWINSTELDSRNLRGKVVLIDFWTYSCINWRRSLPYLRAWAHKYKEHGLVVIGVHTPEFPFETETNNVRWAVNSMRIDYPVAMDSNYAIWRAFNNEFWPALYVIDGKGWIRHHQFGEGAYDESEQVIQQLLAEVGATGFDRGRVRVDASGHELAADWQDLHSDENYLGYERTVNFSSHGRVTFNKPHVYAGLSALKLNHWDLTGEWSVQKRSVLLSAASGRIAYQFHARDLHLVMGPKDRGTPVRFRVVLDGQSPGDSHGTDVDERGFGIVQEVQMYQLIRQSTPIVDRRFEIEFFDAGVEAYSFTFG